MGVRAGGPSWKARLAAVAALAGALTLVLPPVPAPLPPRPAHPAPGPRWSGPSPLLPEAAAPRPAPTREWWRYTTAPHLRRASLECRVVGPVATCRLELRYALPPTAADLLVDEVTTPLWSAPGAFAWNPGGGWQAAPVAREGPPPRLDPVGEGRLLVRLPLPPGDGGAPGVRLDLDAMLPTGADGFTELAVRLGRLPAASLQVELTLSDPRGVTAWDLPPGLVASPAGPSRWRLEGRLERLVERPGLRLRWRPGAPAPPRVPDLADPVRLTPVPLTPGWGLLEFSGAFAGAAPLAVQALVPTTAAATLRLRRFGPRGQPAAPLELRVGRGQGPPLGADDEAVLRLAQAAGRAAPVPLPEPPPRGGAPPPQRPVAAARASARSLCFGNQAALAAALRTLGEVHGWNPPHRWPRGVDGWDRARLPHLLLPGPDPRITGTHRHRIELQLESGRSGWTSFAFLAPRLVTAGALLEPPRDPGFGPGSEGHYLLLGSGEVVCMRHGYHGLLDSPLRRWGGPEMPVREQLERLGVHDPELFALVEALSDPAPSGLR